MRRVVAVLALVAVVLACFVSTTFAVDTGGSRFWIISPMWTRVSSDSAAWRIGFSVVALESPRGTALVERISCGGYNLDTAAIQGPGTQVPVTILRGVTPQALDRWLELRRASELDALSPADALELERLTDIILRSADQGAAPTEMSIDTSLLPFKIGALQDYPVTVRISYAGRVSEFTTIMAARTLPSDSDWSPGDFHLHSTYSDGAKTPSQIAAALTDTGYKIAYVTDHTDLIPSKAGSWANYASYVTGASTSSIKLYPGAEMTVVGFQHIDGDLLAYGVNSLTGLENQLYLAQTGIDNILNNNPGGPSSPAIAHPTGNPAWDDWTVVRYRSMELMSGLQLSFGDGASPMVRWRSELSRLLSNTFSYGYFASARTGSDWHAQWYDPNHPGYVTWIRTSGWTSQSSVDTTLYYGQTVASRKGGLAYMTITYGSNKKQIGERLTGVPAGVTLSLDITFKPVESGTYTIKVYRNNKEQEVFTHTGPYTGGSTYNPASSHTFAFPGGSNYYYLYIYSPDYIYSSPIFVKS